MSMVKCLRIACLLLLFNYTAVAFGVSMEMSGRLPRGSSSKDLYLSIVISNVSAEDLVDSSIPKTVYARLKMTLPNHSSSTTRIGYSGEDTTTATDTLSGYTLIEHNEAEKEPVAGSTSKYDITLSYILRDTGSNEGFNELMAANSNTLNIKAVYTPRSDTEVTATAAVKRQVGVANAAPPNFVAKNEHLGLSAHWDEVTTIAFNDNTSQEPTFTNVYLIDLSSFDAQSFPAITYREDKDSESQDASCTVAMSTDSCTIICPTGTYLDTSAMDQITGVKRYEISYPNHSASFGDLDINKQYAIFAAFEPDALQRSSCYVLSPKENVSLSEMNGAKPATATDPTCFIATAAYGSPLNPHLVSLRWFRDQFLLKTFAGKMFVRFYYRHSPPLAQWIKERPVMRQTVRGLLWVPVHTIEFGRSHPLVFTILLLGVIIALVRRTLPE